MSRTLASTAEIRSPSAKQVLRLAQAEEDERGVVLVHPGAEEPGHPEVPHPRACSPAARRSRPAGARSCTRSPMVTERFSATCTPRTIPGSSPGGAARAAAARAAARCSSRIWVTLDSSLEVDPLDHDPVGAAPGRDHRLAVDERGGGDHLRIGLRTCRPASRHARSPACRREQDRRARWSRRSASSPRARSRSSRPAPR